MHIVGQEIAALCFHSIFCYTVKDPSECIQLDSCKSLCFHFRGGRGFLHRTQCRRRDSRLFMLIKELGMLPVRLLLLREPGIKLGAGQHWANTFQVVGMQYKHMLQRQIPLTGWLANLKWRPTGNERCLFLFLTTSVHFELVIVPHIWRSYFMVANHNIIQIHNNVLWDW